MAAWRARHPENDERHNAGRRQGSISPDKTVSCVCGLSLFTGSTVLYNLAVGCPGVEPGRSRCRA